MASPLAPTGDYTELVGLAGRIRQHLATNPNDAQARDDLRYVVGQLQGPSGATAAANAADKAAIEGPPTSSPGAAATSGLIQAGLDIPRGIASAVMHPITTAGQLTGIGNWGNLVTTLQDPEATAAEKWNAFVRATPANIGYAPERALLEATGVKSDDPASVEEQFHRGGNVASLALLGAKPAALGRVARGLTPPIMGKLAEGFTPPMVRAVGARLLGKAPPTPEAEIPSPAAIQTEMDAARAAEPGLHPDAAQAMRDFEAGKISGADLRTALDVAAGRTPTEPVIQPSRPAVAPTVPEATPTAAGAVASNQPVPPAAVPPQGAVARPAVSQPGPSGGTLPYYPRGGAVEQATAPPPQVSPSVAPAPQLTATMGPEAKALFEGGGVEHVAETMKHPAYQYADILAKQAMDQGLPGFRGLKLADATAALRRMILDHAASTGDVPPILTLRKFLDRLQPEASQQPMTTATATATRQSGHMAGTITARAGGKTYEIPQAWLVGAIQRGQMTMQQAVQHWIEQTELQEAAEH
jgi:hypothetical protein